MKNTIKLLTVCLILTLQSFAQRTEKFDIISFQVPQGWQKEVNQSAVQLGAEDASGGVCIVTLFKPVPGGSDPKANFATAWKEIVEAVVTVAGKPQMNESGSVNGWAVEGGVAPYESDGKRGVAMLVTFTANKQMVNILTLTNSTAFQDDIAKFLESVSLPKAESAPSAAAPPPTQGGDKPDQRLIGRWNRSGSVHPVYADPVSWGTAGYTKSRYEFRADGTYLYTERSFRMLYQYIIIVKESGRYQVSGNQITISPTSSVIESYTKRNKVDELGTLVRSEKRSLETVTYQYAFHYFSGIQEWNLVLQAAKPTQRDGDFSANTTFPNAWYFDQKYIDTDLTAPRAN